MFGLQESINRKSIINLYDIISVIDGHDYKWYIYYFDIVPPINIKDSNKFWEKINQSEKEPFGCCLNWEDFNLIIKDIPQIIHGIVVGVNNFPDLSNCYSSMLIPKERIAKINYFLFMQIIDSCFESIYSSDYQTIQKIKEKYPCFVEI